MNKTYQRIKGLIRYNHLGEDGCVRAGQMIKSLLAERVISYIHAQVVR
jgi:hypothetical protein